MCVVRYKNWQCLGKINSGNKPWKLAPLSNFSSPHFGSFSSSVLTEESFVQSNPLERTPVARKGIPAEEEVLAGADEEMDSLKLSFDLQQVKDVLHNLFILKSDFIYF